MIKWNTVIDFAKNGNPEPPRTVLKSDDQWREQLSDEEFRVTRQSGTERAFSSEMCSLFEAGIYHCVCCDTPLFDSNTKFDSGTGWPSFSDPLADNVIGYNSDESHGMIRIEAVCNVCDAHLGHVFPDGPQDGSGLRYCMNAVSLKKAV